MTMTIESAVAQLRDHPLADRGLLKPGGRKEVIEAIEKWQKKGLSARVVIVERGDSFDEWMGIWDKLGLDANKDLLLLYNGHDWTARGWGLSDSRIREALDAAKPALHRYNAAGIVEALDDLGAASGSGGIGLAPVLGGSIGILAVGGVLGLVIHRRGKLAKEGLEAIRAAKMPAEKAYSDLILACEELPGDEGTRLQLKAAELKKQMDALVEQAESKPAAMSDPVTLGRIRQFESELAALRSTSLQKAKKN